MLDNVKKLEWLRYEVDPEWKRFCSFGPDDIAGPFEKLGIIRKRVIPDFAVVSQSTIDALNAAAWNGCIDPGKGESFSAISLISSPLVPQGGAYLVNMKPFLFNPLNHVEFGDT
jgi:hypothetical protein